MRPAVAESSGTEAGFTLVEVLVAFAIVALATMFVLQIHGDILVRGQRVAAIDIVIDEAESIVQLRAAAGALRPGLEQGRFSNGRIWSLEVADIGPMLGWQNLPPLWRVRLREGGSDGRVIYTTLVAEGLGG
ncbi:hypothetical protein ASG52_09345 [Methylobacterium sp. Leaf456]|uniref:type II secretion system protein n=1 Tax=Methylobacterium sp. Leaf456 TaxID=1736382 RepID=UPI0006F42C34|nr:prepilin-type N-terminal cleavage/methylation domain-containing protein [Methylobacterium sp. Leaf456]KQT49167.1 hypothetical protein ASG52_09345 [Methylobacterium sp. Leaf456]